MVGADRDGSRMNITQNLVVSIMIRGPHPLLLQKMPLVEGGIQPPTAKQVGDAELVYQRRAPQFEDK